jgi:hypothetical protein
VELKKKGYTLAYRRSYFGVDKEGIQEGDPSPSVELAGASGSIPQDDPLSTEMRHGAPMAHDLIFRAEFEAVGAPVMATPQQMSMLVEDAGALRRQSLGKPVKVLAPVPLQTYAVSYRVLVTHAAAADTSSFEFVAAAFDAEGKMLSGVLQNASRDISASGRATASKDNMFRVQQQISVPLSAAWLKVAVRDLATNRAGTLEIRLPLEGEANPVQGGPKRSGGG